MSKKSKHRDCPAGGRPITSAECGSARHTSIACPPSCPHNPLAPAAYDQLLALETKIDHAALRRLADTLGPAAVETRLRARLPEDIAHLGDDTLAINAGVLRALHFERDPAGRSVAERWLADPAARLANDERVVLAAKSRIRVSLVEIREIRPDGLLRAADLLAPEEGEFDLLDRSSWARAARFSTQLVWRYPLPHYHRIFGGGISWPDWSGIAISPADALAEIVTHAGGPAADAPADARADWLARNFVEVVRRVLAVSQVRRLDMFAGLDATHGWAEFSPSPTAARRLLKHLAKSPDVFPSEPDPKDDAHAGYTEAWEWCEAADVASATGAPGRVVIGRVLRREDGAWRIVALGRARLARLREVFLAALAAPVLAPTREFSQDLAGQMALAEPSTDLALVPPRLRENPASLNLSTTRLDLPPDQAAGRIRTQLLANWADTPLPALDGRTPREAVGDPAGRAIVVHFVKFQIAEADRQRLRGHAFADPTPLVRDLGLVELDRPAPPDRPCPPGLLADSDDGNDTSPPPLPPATHPLDADEAGKRADLIYERFPDDDALLDAWDRACPGLGDAVAEHTPDDFTDEQIEAVEFALALAWAILSGGDERPLGIAPNRVAVAARESRERTARSRADDETFRALLGSILSSHPGLLRVILDDLHAREKVARREPQALPTLEAILWLGATLPHYVAALDRGVNER
jgi:hypothetical protein